MRTLSLVLLTVLWTAAAASAVLEVFPGGGPTIQDAVDAAAAGDEILLSPGVYTGPGNRDIRLRGKAVEIRGAADAEAVIIDCQGSVSAPHRGFMIIDGEGGDTVIASLTITGGYAPPGITSIPGGGAVLVAGGSAPRFESCIFRDNEVPLTWDHAGGAVYADGSCDPTFVDCLFAGNRGYFGGAIANNHYGTATIQRCRFEDNVAGRGGAVWGNGTTKIACVFIGNRADQGGAVWQNGWNTDLAVGCTFAGNEAPEGAAYHLTASYRATLEQCLIADNRGGAGIHATASGAITLSCCNLNGNQGGDWTGVFAGQIDGDGNFSAPACFCDLDGGDAHLCADSWSLAGHHPWGCDGLVGALGAGCGDCGCPGQGTVPASPRSWSTVKALFD